MEEASLFCVSDKKYVVGLQSATWDFDLPFLFNRYNVTGMSSLKFENTIFYRYERLILKAGHY